MHDRVSSDRAYVGRVARTSVDSLNRLPISFRATRSAIIIIIFIDEVMYDLKLKRSKDTNGDHNKLYELESSPS